MKNKLILLTSTIAMLMTASAYALSPDPGGDDTAQLQAALDAGGTINLDCGTYIVSDQLSVTLETTDIQGTNKACTKIIMKGTSGDKYIYQESKDGRPSLFLVNVVPGNLNNYSMSLQDLSISSQLSGDTIGMQSFNGDLGNYNITAITRFFEAHKATMTNVNVDAGIKVCDLRLNHP